MDDKLAIHRMNRAVYEAKHRERLETKHSGEHVLMHDGEIIDIYDDLGDAYNAGVKQFGAEKFSIIEIGLTVELGSLQHLIS